MTAPRKSTLYVATSVEDALAALASTDQRAEVLAGATWVMRSDLRGDDVSTHYVSVGAIADLRSISIDATELRIGACVTHTALAEALRDIPDLEAIQFAASKSANPSIRNAATVGGNICSAGFPAADLATALLGLDAMVELRWVERHERLPLSDFFRNWDRDCRGGLLTEIVVPRSERPSSHSRLPMRKAGDYPVAIVSVSVDLSPAGVVRDARVSVGSVEHLPRRWCSFEKALEGHSLDAGHAFELSKTHLAEFAARDGLEAPGWYRVKVLPSLVRKAILQIQTSKKGGFDDR